MAQSGTPARLRRRNWPAADPRLRNGERTKRIHEIARTAIWSTPAPGGPRETPRGPLGASGGLPGLSGSWKRRGRFCFRSRFAVFCFRLRRLFFVSPQFRPCFCFVPIPALVPIPEPFFQFRGTVLWPSACSLSIFLDTAKKRACRFKEPPHASPLEKSIKKQAHIDETSKIAGDLWAPLGSLQGPPGAREAPKTPENH